MEKIMKRVMIVDAFNQFLRGYIVDPSKNPNGQPIGGMRTFINIMNKITREIEPDMIVVVWDGQGGSKKRRAMNKNYKAGRKPLRVNWSSDEMTAQDTDNNKLWQQLRVVEYLNQTPIIQFMEAEVEADDVISYVKSSSMFEDWQKVIVSADKDFIQLLDDKTLLFRPIQKEVLNKNSVIEKFGIHPRNFALARAMAGDPSDNLPGVPRVGMGTIAKRFSFLSEEKDYFVSDLIEECQNSENQNLKIYTNVIESEQLIKENYNIMQLSSPQISPQSKNRIDETFEGYKPHYNQTEVRKLMIQDGVLTVNMQDLEQKFNDIITSFSD
jgi:DNA polymerase-1